MSPASAARRGLDVRDCARRCSALLLPPLEVLYVTVRWCTTARGLLASAPSEPVPWDGSGGGFSWTFKQPQYQAAAVSAYLKDNAAALPPPDAFAASNRAYPGTKRCGGQCVSDGSKSRRWW